jgi:hypothetical protein
MPAGKSQRYRILQATIGSSVLENQSCMNEFHGFEFDGLIGQIDTVEVKTWQMRIAPIDRFQVSWI